MSPEPHAYLRGHLEDLERGEAKRMLTPLWGVFLPVVENLRSCRGRWLGEVPKGEMTNVSCKRWEYQDNSAMLNPAKLNNTSAHQRLDMQRKPNLKNGH